MENTGKNISLNLDNFQSEGLWLIFSDSSQIALTRDIIDQIAKVYLVDPENLPPELEDAKDFRACAHCPKKNEYIICSALKPILPFIASIDQYQSFEEVTAVFHATNSSVLHVSYTTMQQALIYVAILSLVYFCDSSERYCRFFQDINPLVDGEIISRRVYANIYLYHQGNQNDINSTISALKKSIYESTRSLTKRLRLLCENDSFINAFVNANLIMTFLELEVEKATPVKH